MNDDQLNNILTESRPPTASPALDKRVMTSYRKITRGPQWFRVFRNRIAVPVPVVILFIVVFGATVLWMFARLVMPAAPIAVAVPIPAHVREIATCPEPTQPVRRSRRQQPTISSSSLTNPVWTPVSRPEWRILQ